MNTVSITVHSGTKVSALSALYKLFDRLNRISQCVARTSILGHSDPRIAKNARRADLIAKRIRKEEARTRVTPIQATTTEYIDFSVN